MNPSIAGLGCHRVEQRVFLGLDLGQTQDYTALVGVRKVDELEVRDERNEQLRIERELFAERLRRHGGPGEGVLLLPPSAVRVRQSRYEVAHAERVPLGTSYPAIVQYVAGLMARPELRVRGRQPVLVVDSTGVGRAVMDLLVQADLHPVAVTISAGAESHPAPRGHTVPKRDAIAGVLVALQTGRLLIAKDLPQAGTLVEELVNFEVKLSASGHDAYGAARESVHDDLVLALAVALWVAARHQSADAGAFEVVRY
jgi:hypothetical protein